jgi:hypothetical protein
MSGFLDEFDSLPFPEGVWAPEEIALGIADDDWWAPDPSGF